MKQRGFEYYAIGRGIDYLSEKRSDGTFRVRSATWQNVQAPPQINFGRKPNASCARSTSTLIVVASPA